MLSANNYKKCLKLFKRTNFKVMGFELFDNQFVKFKFPKNKGMANNFEYGTLKEVLLYGMADDIFEKEYFQNIYDYYNPMFFGGNSIKPVPAYSTFFKKKLKKIEKTINEREDDIILNVIEKFLDELDNF